jgi:DNA-binding NarL/FixJ family response regulator
MDSTTFSLQVGIADDVGCAREVLARMLEALGHEVVFQVESGGELIRACLEHRPDLVITDNLMPDLLGVDATAQIYEHCPTPVILLSAHTDPEVVLTAELQHVSVYLVKPLDKSTLEAAISLALRRFNESQFGDNMSSPGRRGSKVDEESQWRGTIDQLGGQQAPLR